MFGLFGEEPLEENQPQPHECTTQVEDYRLDNAGDYMRLVSSGISGLACGADCDCPCNKNKINGLGSLNDNFNLGPNYGVWPPGPKPEPYMWTAPNGGNWTRTLLDGKWMYQWSKDDRMYISASNLYDLMGVKKDPDTLLAVGKIPGIPEPDEDKKYWHIGGHRIKPVWAVLGAFALYCVFDKKGR